MGVTGKRTVVGKTSHLSTKSLISCGIRLLALLAAALGVAVLMGTLAPASASTDRGTLRARPEKPTDVEPVTFYGSFPQAGPGQRIVLESSQDGKQEWTYSASAKASKNGRFRFSQDPLGNFLFFRATLQSEGRITAKSNTLKLSVTHVSVDDRWVRGNAGANRDSLFSCIDGSSDCDPHSPGSLPRGTLPAGFVVFLFIVCFGAVAFLIFWASRSIPDSLRWFVVAALELLWLPIFYNLAFGYALPRIGLDVNLFAALFGYPLYLALLVFGLVIMVGYPLSVLWTIRKDPLPPGRGTRAIVFAVTVGALLLWRLAYDRVPEIAAGPFSIKTVWLSDALHTWSLNWPVTLLWEVLSFFATPTGIILFGTLAAVSLVLPRSKSTGAPAGALTTLTNASVTNVVTLVVGLVVTLVIGLLLFAAAALALFAFTIYFLIIGLTTTVVVVVVVRQ